MSASGYVHLEDCNIKAVTANAVLVEWDGDDYWFPASQVADPDVFEKGDEGVTVSVTEWIANQKGIET
jgi:hypothetical protein